MTVAAPCKHHWKIEEAHGPVALGVCRLCGMTKWFETSYGYHYNVTEALQARNDARV